MTKLNNILNPKSAGSDGDLDRRIKRNALIWPLLSLFYLWAKLEISSSNSTTTVFGFSIKGLDKGEPIIALLIINLLVLFALFWRVEISYQYNKIENHHNSERAKWFRLIDKYLIGLAIPYLICMFAIICLAREACGGTVALWSIGILSLSFIRFIYVLLKCN